MQIYRAGDGLHANEASSRFRQMDAGPCEYGCLICHAIADYNSALSSYAISLIVFSSISSSTEADQPPPIVYRSVKKSCGEPVTSLKTLLMLAFSCAFRLVP